MVHYILFWIQGLFRFVNDVPSGACVPEEDMLRLQTRPGGSATGENERRAR
ncbi:MAG: hypothetical protein ACE5H4_11555 [Candidatus Thorarchaeota archaeon]